MAAPRIPTGPLDREPVGFLTGDQQRAMLLDVLVGVELGTWDKSIVQWLAGWDSATVTTMCSLIDRVRRVAWANATAAAAARSTDLSPNDLAALQMAASILDHHGRKELGDGLRHITQRVRPPRRRKSPEPRPPQT